MTVVFKGDDARQMRSSNGMGSAWLLRFACIAIVVVVCPALSSVLFTETVWGRCAQARERVITVITL